VERIVVGFDGSDPAVAALRWAVAEARLRRAGVEAWTIAGRPRTPPGQAGREVWVLHDREALASMVAATGGDAVRHVWLPGCAADELVAQSRSAALVVLGSQAEGVVQALLDDSRCPVVIVRADHEPSPERPVVVVGVNGTPQARQALAVAGREAAVRCAELRVVYAAHADPARDPLCGCDEDDLLAWGRDMIRAECSALAAVRTIVTTGRPADVLIQHSRDSSLLVLGAGHRLATRCARSAACPVLVAR
jgi:nucleotide-binding universal stress UspA family protein